MDGEGGDNAVGVGWGVGGGERETKSIERIQREEAMWKETGLMTDGKSLSEEDLTHGRKLFAAVMK